MIDSREVGGVVYRVRILRDEAQTRPDRLFFDHTVKDSRPNR